MKRSVLLSVLVFFLVPILISSSSVQAETRFMVVDLGPSRVPLDINNSGQVCGAWLSRPFSWDNGIFSSLQDTSLPHKSVASGINSSGIIVGGNESEPNFRWRAFQFDSNLDQLTFQGELGLGRTTFRAINDAGVVVGRNLFRIGTSTRILSAVYDVAGGVITDSIVILPGGLTNSALDINNSGNVVGISETGEPHPFGGRISHAFFWDGSSVIDLGVPGEVSSAVAVNNKDQVVGDFFTLIGTPIRSGAYMWESGVLTKLDGLESARDINDSGDVVGELNDANGKRVGALWLSRPAYGLQAGIHKLSDLGSFGNFCFCSLSVP